MIIVDAAIMIVGSSIIVDIVILCIFFVKSCRCWLVAIHFTGAIGALVHKRLGAQLPFSGSGA